MVLGVLQALLPERLPTTTQLLANAPNPFNPEHGFHLSLSQQAEVTLLSMMCRGNGYDNYS